MERIQRGGRPVAGFALGTVLGVQTVQDLDRLIQNKDAEMAAIGAQVAKSADASIREDWAALSKAYQTAKASGLKAIADVRSGWSLMPDSLNATADTDAAYKAIILALQPVPDQITKGSKQDIASRLLNTGWKPTYTIPFPLQSDADSSVYKATDPSNLPNPDAFFDWLKEHKTALIVGGSVVGGVIVLGVLSPYARLLSSVVPHRRST